MIYPSRRRSLACSRVHAKGWRQDLPSTTFDLFFIDFEKLESLVLKPNALLPWESDAYARLEWLPQAVRFKLDLVGAKVGLKQWQMLDLSHRQELLILPAESPREIAAYGQKLRDILTADRAGDLQSLPPAGPREYKTEIQDQWKSVGFALTLEKWSQWTEYERFLAEKTAFSKSAQVPLQEIAPYLGLTPV